MGPKGETGPAGPSSGNLIAVRTATTAALPTNTLTGNVLEATANGALPSQDGVALAVGNFLLVKNEAEGKKHGVYEVTGLGAAGSKWKLTRVSSMDTSAEAVPGMLITVSEGMRNGDRVFQLATDAPITLNTTALSFVVTSPKDFGLVTELPTSKVLVGDLCTYKASAENGVYWHLVYDGEGEYPWKKIGGAALVARQDTGRSLTNQTAFANLPTDPLSISVPLKGDYDISILAGIDTATGSTFGAISYAVGATAASDSWGAFASNPGGGSSMGVDVTKKTRHTAVPALASVAEKARTGGNYTFTWSRRRLRVDPVRVG